MPDRPIALLVKDRHASTVTIHSRTFPSCGLICPQDDGEERNEFDRSLGVIDTAAWIPAENGVLFRVEALDDGRTLTVQIDSRVCVKSYDPGGWTWLPAAVVLLDGRLVPEPPGHPCVGQWDWRKAEPWWVVEHIDRLSVLPFTEPDGPRCLLVRLDYFAEAT